VINKLRNKKDLNINNYYSEKIIYKEILIKYKLYLYKNITIMYINNIYINSISTLIK